MSVITESALNAELRAGNFRRVYFLYGEEDYLVKVYGDRIVSTAVPEDARDMNYVRYNKFPDTEKLSDYLDNVPFFADYKCVLIEDLNPAALEDSVFKTFLAIIKRIPDTAVLIISQRNISIDPKKPGENMKKLMAACEEAGAVCEFKKLTPDALAKKAAAKFSRAGCSISYGDARFLAEECECSLTTLQIEIEKLCSYKQNGEITRADIEALVPRNIDTRIYDLAKELFAGRKSSALHILDDLFIQGVSPTYILTALSGHFVDLYRAKLARQAKKSSADAAKDYGYYGRAFVMNNAFGSVGKLSLDYLKGCVAILYDTNRLLNSSRSDQRTLIEQAMIEISALKK